MSFFTHFRDFVEDTVTVGLGGSALFGTVGGLAAYATKDKTRDVLKAIGTSVVGSAFISKMTQAGLPAYRSQLFASQVQPPAAPPRAAPIARPTVPFLPVPSTPRPPRGVPARYRAFL